jgi:hypothetical protein
MCLQLTYRSYQLQARAHSTLCVVLVGLGIMRYQLTDYE